MGRIRIPHLPGRRRFDGALQREGTPLRLRRGRYRTLRRRGVVRDEPFKKIPRVLGHAQPLRITARRRRLVEIVEVLLLRLARRRR